MDAYNAKRQPTKKRKIEDGSGKVVDDDGKNDVDDDGKNVTDEQ